ncbi:hypothetical protein BofuT4_uP112490.1 [Botrytis cinerea T4]|uniref:Uncharacterized protein n=1 Tax=Botryotinia fuckeliana (strain T4) TaxID=999810 RepID=G2Y5J9_BOTF4|nr:hypothetical protein BofuT4_uP112490.1 [Botrytis cinerea T4]
MASRNGFFPNLSFLFYLSGIFHKQDTLTVGNIKLSEKYQEVPRFLRICCLSQKQKYKVLPGVLHINNETVVPVT